jgi:DNA-binding GntR family transcriptional regulator
MNTPSAPADDDGAPSLARLNLPAVGGALSRGSMPKAVADVLREAILDGLLAPGAWLREAEIARELQVSRTPIRDAFRMLAAEGLVNINANQGAVVSPMTGEDVIELYVMREVLEGLASRLAARRAARRCLEEFSVLIPEMKRVGEAGEIKQLSRLNFKFHEIVREGASNRYLDRTLSPIQNAARRFPDPTLGLPGRVKESIEEHVALADAISRGDAQAAEKLAVEHMRHLSELRIQMLLRN